MAGAVPQKAAATIRRVAANKPARRIWGFMGAPRLSGPGHGTRDSRPGTSGPSELPEPPEAHFRTLIHPSSPSLSRVPSPESHPSGGVFFGASGGLTGLGVLSLEDRKEFLQHAAFLFLGLLRAIRIGGRDRRIFVPRGSGGRRHRHGGAVAGVEQSAQNPTAALLGCWPLRFRSLDKVLVAHHTASLPLGRVEVICTGTATMPGGGSKGLASR